MFIYTLKRYVNIGDRMKIKNWSRIKEGTALIVTWNDIKSDPGWNNDTEAHEFQPAYCKNIGWFVNDDKDNIRLTWSVCDDGDKAIEVIPKGCIIDVKRINKD